MSWLYSVFFAGLLLSSGGDLPASKTVIYTNNESANFAAADETERFEQTYPLSAAGKVSVSNVNGSITVDVWDRNEVKLIYVKTADTKENLDDVRVIIDARQNSFAVETEFEAIKNRTSKNYKRLDVEYRLTVPRGAVLNEIETVNGSVGVTGATNMTRASSVNGEVRAANLRGTANLSTVNGTVVADFNELQTGGKISLSTVNGSVNLTIPSDASATIKADTVNGNISNDFGLPVRKGEYVGQDLYGKVGGGDIQIRLNSVNGALSVRRKNDGKAVNPATNLLNMKNESDDENWDDGDEDNNTSHGKPPRAPKPPRPSNVPQPPNNPLPPIPPAFDNEAINKYVEEAFKEASRALGTIDPELQKTYTEDLRRQIREAGINLNSEEMQAQIREAQERYKEALVALADAKWTTGAPVIEKKSGAFPVKGTPKVTIETKNCDVAVRGWDKPEVSYSAIEIRRGSQGNVNRNLTVSATNTDSAVDLKVLLEDKSAAGSIFDEQTNMRVEIYVPRKSNLKIVGNREIRLEGISGTVDLRGADEAVDVRDGDGLLTVNTFDGRIRVIGFRGELESRTRNGSMFLDGGLKRLLAGTSSGEIILTVPENENAMIGSNTEITVEGVEATETGAKKWQIGKGGANYFLQSASGRIYVRPENRMKID